MRKLPTVLLLVVAACSSAPPAALRVVAVDDTGASVTGRDAHFDFGLVPRSTDKTLPLVVQNAGNTVLTLTGFTFVSGDAVSAKPGVDQPGPLFSVDLAEGLVLQPGTQREYLLHFAPSVNATVGASFETVLSLHATTATGTDEARLTLAGVAVDADPCALPAALDFGPVNIGREGRQTFTVTNPGPTPRTITIGAPLSLTGEDVFFVAPESPQGEVTLEPGTSRDVTLRFVPQGFRAYVGRTSVTLQGCSERTMNLSGEGVDSVLSCAPASLDFGFTQPGAIAERGLTCRNSSFESVALTALGTFDGSAPSTTFSIPSGATSLAVPPGHRGTDGALVPGEATVVVRFTPTVLGPKTGTLRATLPTGIGLITPLRGTGGGPDVEVTPAPLVDLGEVPFFAGSTPPSSSTVLVQVRNVGALVSLKLGVPDGAGGFHGPFWQVTAKNAETQVSELCVGAFDASTGSCLQDLSPTDYNPLIGIEPRATAVLSIPFRVTPAGVGHKEWEVQLFTNDPDEPVVTLTVTANVESLPPCNFAVSTPTLPFGLVEPGAQRTLPVRVQNLGTQPSEVCVLSGFQLTPEVSSVASVPAVFSFVTAPSPVVRLQPGEVLEVPLRAAPLTDLWPATPTMVNGALQFHVSAPNAGTVSVPLRAEVGRGCLVLHSESLDFGAQAPSCRAAPRELTLFNRCASAVTVSQVSLPLAGGLRAASGPACPGPSACPEFELVSPPATPLQLPSGSLALQLGYQPLDLGEDLGLLALRTTESGQPHEYVVELHGRGDAQGVNVETFALPTKADVLLVIDASGSMAAKQLGLSGAFSSFIQFAQAQRVDYRVGVTVAEPTGGRLRSVPSGERVVTPTTANASQVFAQLVNLPVSSTGVETCVAPASAAVSSPLVVQPNGNLGFFRPDASLAVVCVTDAPEQAVTPWMQAEALRRGRPVNQLSYSVIGPFLPAPPSGCSYDGVNTSAHGDLVSGLSGTAEEVCTPDWSQVMQRVGQVAFGARETFFLVARPDPMGTPLEVKVDGAVVPGTLWTYDVVSNAVRFASTSPVVAGQTVEVTYPVACMP